MDYYEVHRLNWVNTRARNEKAIGLYMRGPFLDLLLVSSLETFFGGIARMERDEKIERERAQVRADIAYRDYLTGVPA